MTIKNDQELIIIFLKLLVQFLNDIEQQIKLGILIYSIIFYFI